jgi:hypothetical protein
MNTIIEYAPGAAVGLVALGIIAYALTLAVATISPDAVPDAAAAGATFGTRLKTWFLRSGARLRAWFVSSPAQNIGVPCSAIASFAIVTVLWKAFPPLTSAGGELLLKAFGLEFSGPSGPITLWLLCFLGFIFALKLLRT